MNVEHLKVLRDLAEAKNFSKTAQIHGVTQSAVSQNLFALERQFGSLLIERGGHHFCLTAEGKLVYDYSKRILRSCDSLQGKIQEAQRVRAANIHVASIASIGLYSLPPYLKPFLKDYPGVKAHLE